MKLILRILALLALTGSAYAATINAASCGSSDVQTALNSASAGDTVVIPAGSCNWTTAVSWTAPTGVTVLGAGTSATGGGDQTNITDNLASGSPLLQISVNASGTFRLSGITFKSGTGAIKDGGTIQINGPGNVRVDHCHFLMTSSNNYQVVAFRSGIRGVLDSSILDFSNLNALYFFNGRSGVGESQGNYEWTQPTAFGTADFFYIEDNIVNGTVGSGAYSTRIWDGFTASKVVVRLNTVSQAVLSEVHATGHSPDDRGTRAQEVYGNLVTSSLAFDPNFVMSDLSSGGGLAWGNSADQVYKNMFRMNVTRGLGQSAGGAYNQTPTPGGWGYAGTNFNGTGSNWDGGTALTTDTLYGYPALDQPGRGAGDLLVGNFPSKLNDSTGTLYWPNQAKEPIYIWSNVGSIVSGWGGNYYSADVRVAANRDYYPQAAGIQTTSSSPFNGTVGTGWGTLANRPATCTTGVGYFATDQGSWNQSTSNPYGVQLNGADGVLYVATSTNTWTLAYTPYTYPHPLRGGQVEAPQFSPAAGTFASAQSVTITSATVGASIRYTTNGDTPTSGSGTVYSTPVSISTTATLKAVAYNGVLSDSNVTTGTYTIGTPPTPGGDAVATSVVTVELTLP